MEGNRSQEKTRQVNARHDKTRHHKTRQDKYKTRIDNTRQDKTREDTFSTRQDKTITRQENATLKMHCFILYPSKKHVGDTFDAMETSIPFLFL